VVIGGQDGSVTILVVAHSFAEMRSATQKMLKKLPSRKCSKKSSAPQVDDLEDDEAAEDKDEDSLYLSAASQSDGSFDQRQIRKLKVLRRFR
jgi:hypothetical protein